MIMSFHGKVLRVAGPFKGPVAGGFLSQMASNAGFDIFFDFGWNKQSSAGDLRRHVGDFDVTAIKFAQKILNAGGYSCH